MRALFWRATPGMLLSFAASALVNIVPQVHLARAHPETKARVLALVLLTGTAASVAGVAAAGPIARVLAGSPRARAVAWSAGFVAVGLCFCAMFRVSDPASYLAINAVARFAGNWLTQALDRAAHFVASGELDSVARNDRVTAGTRLLGMLAAPLLFGLWYAPDGARALAALGTAVSIAAAVPLARVEQGEPVTRHASERARVDPRERALRRYAVGYYAALYVVASQMVYLLRDHLGIARAAARGGAAIAVVYVSAVAAIAARATVARRAPWLATAPSAKRLMAWPAVIAALTLPLSATRHVPLWAVYVGVAIAGFTLGNFQLDVRYRLTHSEETAPDRGLEVYNNLPNVSGLVAFGLLAVVGFVRERAGIAYGTSVLLIVLGLSLASALSLWPRASVRR